MYLEISSIAAALGKNPYESREKTLLTSWARQCPEVVFNYLLRNNCIIDLKANEESFSEMQKELYTKTISKVDTTNFDTKDFAEIEKKIVSEYQTLRNNEHSESEVKKLVELTQDSLKKDNGNIQELNLIKKEHYTAGNNKMYYFKIGTKTNKDEKINGVVGGKHDATTNDLLIEIKTRVKKVNVRRNDYDLYQLIGYLIATKKPQGKIVQIFNKTKFDSNEATETEYGLIDITQEPWNEYVDYIKLNLGTYFKDLHELINTQNYRYLDTIIPKTLRPIAKMDKHEKTLVEENIKYKNLLRHLHH